MRVLNIIKNNLIAKGYLNAEVYETNDWQVEDHEVNTGEEYRIQVSATMANTYYVWKGFQDLGEAKTYTNACKLIPTKFEYKTNFRIKKANGRYLNVGTDKPSWFKINDAREIVDYDKGQCIIEHDGVRELHEIL